MARSKKPIPPKNLADFVANAVAEATVTDDRVLEVLRDLWREALEKGFSPPTRRSIAARCGMTANPIGERVKRLIEAGAVLEYGAGRTSVIVPNESEFTSGLDGMSEK